MKTKTFILLIITLFIFLTTSCSDADIASSNISRAADQFEIFRRVVFYNGITDKYILVVEGYCSVEAYNGKLTVTVKTKPGTYLKHYLGLSDNVTFFAEQVEPSKVRTDRYRVIFKPSAIVPNIDIK